MNDTTDRYVKGSTDSRGDCGFFESGINMGNWSHHIVVYGETREDAEQLRDFVMNALNRPEQNTPRCRCCGYLVTQSEHRGCLRAAVPLERDSPTAKVSNTNPSIMVPMELFGRIDRHHNEWMSIYGELKALRKPIVTTGVHIIDWSRSPDDATHANGAGVFLKFDPVNGRVLSYDDGMWIRTSKKFEDFNPNYLFERPSEW